MLSATARDQRMSVDEFYDLYEEDSGGGDKLADEELEDILVQEARLGISRRDPLMKFFCNRRPDIRKVVSEISTQSLKSEKIVVVISGPTGWTKAIKDAVAAARKTGCSITTIVQ